MKKSAFKRLSNIDRAAISELAISDAAGSLLRVRMVDKKPISDLPLFASKDKQTSLF